MLYTIKLTQQQLNYIGIVLGKCPYGEVKELVETLQAQITELEKQLPADSAAPS